MANFAGLSDDEVVVLVVRVPDVQEHRGEKYLRDDLGLGGHWVQTSYNNSIRKQYAAPGMLYLGGPDVFITPQPFPSWSLDENYDWQAPFPQPDAGDYIWIEADLAWIEMEAEPTE